MLAIENLGPQGSLEGHELTVRPRGDEGTGLGLPECDCACIDPRGFSPADVPVSPARASTSRLFAPSRRRRRRHRHDRTVVSSQRMSTAGGFDVVIVGGGSAGCVVAARLSEDTARRVLLVEAGPDPDPVPELISDPSRQSDVIRDQSFVRHYLVTRPDGSTFPLVSGRVMGGGSAVNHLSVQRPIRQDFEAWEAFGGAPWSFDELLRFYRAAEDDPEFGDDPLHGRGGPIRLERLWRPTDESAPAVRALVQAALANGLPFCDDANVPEPFGLSAGPYALVGGRRQTVADAYLAPARGRPNLTILPDTTVTRLIHQSRQDWALELSAPNGARTVTTDAIVLSAGAYQSPHLLLCSGIGPTSKIESVGLTVVHRLDGVGENFQDHAVVPVTFAAGPALSPDHRVPKLRFIAKSQPDLPYGDLHFIFPPPVATPHGALELAATVRLLDHRSRGRLSLVSADPSALPAVDPSILTDARDVEAVPGH